LEYFYREKKTLVNRVRGGEGRKCLVADSVFTSFKTHLQDLEQQHFTSADLLNQFSAFEGAYRYSPAYFSHLLREKLKLHYYKPSPQDYRRPADAEAKLAERIQASLDALAVMNKDITDFAIGFSDECAAQLHSNNARFWSLEAHLPRTINSQLGTQKFFGFYALQGESMLSKMKNCTAEDFKPLLLEIKMLNPTKKGIILFWDNASAHKKIEAWAWQQGIYIIFIPPYSPDLNPIERVWKSCKRWVNEKGYCKKIEELSQVFQKAYDIYKVQLSFASGWCEKMSPIFSWNNTKQENSTG